MKLCYSLLLILILTCTNANCDEQNPFYYEFVDFSNIDWDSVKLTTKQKEDFKAIEVIKEGEPVKCGPAKPVGFPFYMSHGHIDCSKERIEKQEKISMYELKDVFYINRLNCFFGFTNSQSMFVLGCDPNTVKIFLSGLEKRTVMLVVDNGIIPDFVWYKNQYHDLVGGFGLTCLANDKSAEKRTFFGLTRFVKEFAAITKNKNVIDFQDLLDIIQIVHFKEVLVQSMVCHYQPEIMNKTRELFLPHIERKEEKQRLYVSRGDASYRKVVNEGEVIKCLEKYGFQPVSLDGKSLLDQAGLFANAEIVIGPHGAGMTNTMFCDPGTKVVELFSRNMRNLCMLNIAEVVGLDYWYLADAPTTIPTPFSNSVFYNMDYNINIALLEKWLQTNAPHSDNVEEKI